MKRLFSFTDLLYGALLCAVLLTYYEFFGENGALYNLIHTPYYLIFLPTAVYLVYHAIRKRPLHITASIFMITLIFTVVFAGRNLTSVPLTQNQQTPVRICSWNTAYFFAWGEDAGFARLANENCTYIVLQEVWRATEQQDKLRVFQEKYLPTMTFFTEGEFVIFAPTKEASVAQRSQTDAYLRLDTAYKGIPLRIYSIHLWNPITSKPLIADNTLVYKTPQQARREQKAELLSRLDESSKDVTTVVVGDFNSMQNSEIIREITNRNTRRFLPISVPFGKNRNTFTSQYPLIQIDYAFISSDMAGGSKMRTSCEYSASDHCLLIIDLML